MDRKRVVVDFLTAFCAGDIDGVAGVLAEEFRLNGPLYQFSSKAEYIESLRSDPPGKGEFELMRLLEDGATVSVLYRYIKGGSSLIIAQFCEFADGKICDMQLVFDGRAFA